MKTLGSVLDWCSLSVELQQFTVAEVLPFASFEKWSVFMLQIQCLFQVHCLYNARMHKRATSHLPPLTTYNPWRFHFILSCILQQSYPSSADKCYAKNILRRNHLSHTEPGCQTLQFFPKQLAACTPFLHKPLQTQVTPYLFLVSLDWAVLMVLPSWVISLSWEAGASLTASGSTTVSWVTGKTSSSAPCCPKCCLA